MFIGFTSKQIQQKDFQALWDWNIYRLPSKLIRKKYQSKEYCF